MTTDYQQILTDTEIEQGRHCVFSTDNPFCPCDTKTMRKAVRWAEQVLLSKLRGAGEPARDWTEDFAHENGNYQCACVQCGEHFFGHKRRVVCKACFAAPQASAEARKLVADGWLDDHITENVKFTRGEMPGVYYCQGWRDAEAHYKLAAPAAEDSAKGAGDVEFPRMPEPAARTSAFSTNSQVVPYYTYGQMMAYAHTAVLADRKQRGGDVAALREALKFYADQDHFIIADDDAWDTVSGEPQNFFCDEAGTATVEDGSIARAALAAQNPVEGDAKEPIVTLSGHQLLEALDFIAPDRDTDPQQLEGDVSIQYGDGHAGRGHYCWVTDEAHEGAILLGDAAIAQQGKEGA